MMLDIFIGQNQKLGSVKRKFFSKKSYPIIISRLRDYDINTIEDWKIAEKFWKERFN